MKYGWSLVALTGLLLAAAPVRAQASWGNQAPSSESSYGTPSSPGAGSGGSVNPLQLFQQLQMMSDRGTPTSPAEQSRLFDKETEAFRAKQLQQIRATQANPNPALAPTTPAQPKP